MDEKNVVIARIAGTEYTIAGTESAEYISKVCNTVDSKMRSFSKMSSYNPMRAAVLCSVNMCDELLKCEDKLNETLAKLSSLEEKIAELEKKNMVLGSENEYLKRALKDNKKTPGENI